MIAIESVKTNVEATALVRLGEAEIRALLALSRYGVNEFMKIACNHLSPAMAEHEAAIGRIFSAVIEVEPAVAASEEYRRFCKASVSDRQKFFIEQSQKTKP